VPTLEVAPGKSLYESNVLCEYLEDHYISHQPRLLPLPGISDEQDYARAKARIWIDYVTSRVIPSYHRFLQFQPDSVKGGAEEGEKKLDELRAEFRNTLLEFAREMVQDGKNRTKAEDGPFFLGRDISLVDIALLPWAVSSPFQSCRADSVTDKGNRYDSGSLTSSKVVSASLVQEKAARTNQRGPAGVHGSKRSLNGIASRRPLVIESTTCRSIRDTLMILLNLSWPRLPEPEGVYRDALRERLGC
jgi:glutathione S-transferase